MSTADRGDPWKSRDDRYRLAPDIRRSLAAATVALGILFFGSGTLGPTLAFLVAAAVGYCIADQIPTKLARTVTLALAVWSHGPVAGIESDCCYPARATHFLGWIRTGANSRVVPKLPEQGRWCAHCAAPEWCLAPDGTVHPHDYEPASEDS